MQVLVVDDEPDVRHLLELNVRALGHEPVVATGAADAYAVCAAARPDAMLLDVSMPDGDGVSLLEILRADGLEPDATVLVSAQPPRTLAATAARLGVRHLSKPVTARQIGGELGLVLDAAA